jgi:hypothetical protein
MLGNWQGFKIIQEESGRERVKTMDKGYYEKYTENAGLEERLKQ